MFARCGRACYDKRKASLDPQSLSKLIRAWNVIGDVGSIPLHGSGDLDALARHAHLLKAPGIIIVLCCNAPERGKGGLQQRTDQAIAAETAGCESTVDHAHRNAPLFA